MKSLYTLLLCLTLALATGCAAKFAAPTSGPTAKVTVEVENFAPNRSILNNENVYLTIHNADESWEGQEILKNSNPSYSVLVPANHPLSYGLVLMQGGGGFSSSTGVRFDLTLPDAADLDIKFKLFRGNGPEIIGCTATLYSGDRLIGTYKGSAKITKYVVKWLP